jgi:hypothetical protein
LSNVPIMHTAIQLLLFWAVAFVTLCTAVVLMNIFNGLIENDLELHTLGKEAAIAGVASLIEEVSVWLFVYFIPAAQRAAALRAFFIPAIIVGLIYKVAHLENWRSGNVLLLLVFQAVICCSGANLFLGHFGLALIVLALFGIILAIIAGFARNL